MKKNNLLLVINQDDNVGIILTNRKLGSHINFFCQKIELQEDAYVGDRIALNDIKINQPIYQYGHQFCSAKQNILTGEVITANKIIDYNINIEKLDLSLYDHDRIDNNLKTCVNNKFMNKKFLGYKRGKLVGTRNYYVIIPTSFCATDIVNKLALKFDTKKILAQFKNIDGIVSAGHTEGCGCGSGDIIDRLLTIIKNFISHPNCGGALIIDLGCEKTNYNVMHQHLGNLNKFKKPIDFISIQKTGGTTKSFKKGKTIIARRLPIINKNKRKKCNLSSLVLGTECGASDSFSGITANPLIGFTADQIVDLHGKVILSETPEMLGTEEILLKRMPDIKTREKFKQGLLYYKNIAHSLNINMSGNLVAGNLKGGLINLSLKSLGSIQKGGSRDIVDFLDYGEKIKKTGLSLMNGPGNDFESITGITASGATIFLFSTGLGTTEGSLISPVIKVASNSKMYHRLKDDMDFNAGRVLNEDIEKVSRKLMKLLIKVASGKKTVSERHKKRSFQIWTAGKLSL